MIAVLDASAILAFLNEESGADQVAAVMSTAWISTVNFAEVVGKVLDAGEDTKGFRMWSETTGMTIEPLSDGDALIAGELRGLHGGHQLSLADRCCLALALRLPECQVLTADRAWVDLDLPLRIDLIR